MKQQCLVLQSIQYTKMKVSGDSSLKEATSEHFSPHYFTTHTLYEYHSNFPMQQAIMYETLIKCKMALHLFPRDTVIKSCIMHVHHSDVIQQ